MKRIALAAVAALCLAMLGATATAQVPPPQPTPIEARCTVGPFRAFSAAVWNPSKWERDTLPAAVRAAQRARLACAPPGHRAAMKRTWRRDHAAWLAHRRAELTTRRLEPYVCGTRRYALPCGITQCESGFYFGHHSGAYGLLDSTWIYYGGGRYAPYPGAATPRQQAIIARKVWAAHGESAWECKADGSTSWP